MKIIITFFLILSFYHSSNAYSQSFISDGNIFLETCKGSYETCQGYLQGINDAVQAFKFWGELSNCYFQLPSNVTDKQLVDLMTKHYESNPQFRHGLGANIIINKLSETFPCGGQETQNMIDKLKSRLELLLLFKNLNQ